MKISRLLPVLLICALVPMLFFTGCEDYRGDADQLLQSVQIQAEVQENGDMRVTEQWDIQLDDRDRVYTNLYKTFPYSSEQQITDFTVYDNDLQQEYRYAGSVSSVRDLDSDPETCYVAEDLSLTEIGWFIEPIYEGERSFTISYTVTNAIQQYDDVGVLYHGFIGDQFSIPIQRLSAEITLPQGAAQEDLRAWLHCTAESFLTIDSGSQISFTAEKVPAGTYIEVRLCAPSSLFTGVQRVGSGSVLPDIQEEEAQWASQWEAQQRRQRMEALLFALGGGAALALGIGFGAAARVKKRRHKIDAPEYYREILPGSSPGGAANLFYYYSGGVKGNVQGRVCTATMMSLARKKHIFFEENPLGAETRSKDDDIIIRLAPEGTGLPLTPSEEIFQKLLAQAAGSPEGSFTLDDFEDYAKKQPKRFHTTMQRFLTASRKEIAGNGYYEKELPFVKTLRSLAGFALLGAVVLFFALEGRAVLLSAGLAVGSLLALFLCGGQIRLSPAGEHDLACWNGLKKFMLDFSNMKEYGVFQLPLWEEYLVYAAMMGISKEAAEQLRKAYPQVWEPTDEVFLPHSSYLYWTMYRRPAFYHSGGSLYGDRISRIMENASRSAAAAVAAANAKSSGGSSGGGFGGGGFNGGGGGFGSGGGGGVR